MIEFDIDVPRTGGFLSRAFRSVFGRDVQTKLQLASKGVQGWARDEIRLRLRKHETYRALLPGGLLSYELGLGENEQPLVEECVEYLAESLQVTILPAAGESLGGVRLVMLSRGLPELLARRFASYVSHGRYGSSRVPWLNWLLTGGSEILLADHAVLYFRRHRAGKWSRTGIALTLSNSRTAGGWSLPRAGTDDDNWVVNVLESVAKDAADRIAAEVRGVLR